MGECNYYLKARFRSGKEAETARGQLAELLTEGEMAYRYWQDSRAIPFTDSPQQVPLSAEGFWWGFRENYPLTYRYLRDIAGIADWDNGLAGHLGCLVSPRRDRSGLREALLYRKGDMLFLQLNGIWHFTEMGLLERYCREDLKAVGVGSVSDEDFDLDEDSDLEEDTSTRHDFDPFDAIDI